jgi:osmoprotectant transport system ATP-binding protein
MIELFNISRNYGKSVALHPLDLTIPAGQTTLLIGPSGCGKSTLLRLIMRLIEPDSGSVRFGEVELTPANIRLMRRRMGYVIQDGGLFPHFTAEENVSLMAQHLKHSREQIQRRLQELTELTQFPRDGLSRYPLELSGGQRQRVSLMRALMLDPEVLLLDEPLGALDPMVRSALQEDLKRIFRLFGKTVVLVTHDLAEAAYFGDDIVLLNQGRIIQRGPLAKLRQEPASPFVTDFLHAQRKLAFSHS